MRGSRLALATALWLVTSCSVLTSLEGLSGDPGGGAGDGGALADVTVDGRPADAPADSAPPRPRAWRRLDAKGPPAVHSARMVFDEARGRAVLYGGNSPNTWLWDGSAWSMASLGVKPTARNAPGLAYDSARRVVMVFGGSATAPEPWEWDGGGGWTSSGISPTSPSVGYSAAMAYDRARNVLVIFGGLRRDVKDTDNGETWEWSASGGFTKRTPPISPPARHAHVMVYDAARARVVLFGGTNGPDLNDLWEYDGTTWTQRTAPLAPAPRRAPGAAYDSARKTIVVFGGRDQRKALDDTWEWNGNTWQRGANGPSARSSSAMTYDPARDQVVLFGGSARHVGTAPPETTDDTWVYE